MSSCLAHSSVICHSPSIATDSYATIKQSFWIPLLLYGQQLVVVTSVEDVLPIGLPEVAFIDISTHARRGLFEKGLQGVGDQVLLFENITPRIGEAKWNFNRRGNDCFTPSR